jgi:hypothetical protein
VPDSVDPRDEAFAAVVRMVQSITPAPTSCRIVFGTEDSGEGVIPVPLRVAQGAANATEAVLEVLGTLKPGGELRGKALSKQTGHSYCPKFRSVLSSLVKNGRIVKGANGYRLTK